MVSRPPTQTVQPVIIRSAEESLHHGTDLRAAQTGFVSKPPSFYCDDPLEIFEISSVQPCETSCLLNDLSRVFFFLVEQGLLLLV